MLNEPPYLGPEGDRPGRPAQAVRHTCAGNLGIVKILRYLRSDMYTASATNSKLVYITRASKRNLARWNKTALGPPLQVEISLKIEDLRSNKTTGKLS